VQLREPDTLRWSTWLEKVEFLTCIGRYSIKKGRLDGPCMWCVCGRTEVHTVVCAPDDGWKYHPKHVEHFPGINKLCNVASCWMYIGILLGAHYILHISRIGLICLIFFAAK
jgi:hypothetical protein